MFRAIIIDDEARIVEGLQKLIPWGDFDAEVVAVAYDVKSGIELVNKHKPDILFTDIRMPDGNGLQMLAGLRSEHPDMQVTVLTGYKDFEYARQAINLGVVRFLLKPSKMDELIEALQTMTTNLENIAKTNETAMEEDVYVNSFVVREAMDYIQENCHEKLSLADVANACFVSQWHLSKLLSKNTDQNFYDILNGARITASKKLLEDPSLRIGEISTMVGYADSPHFSRVFKKIEGMSPNEYRNSKL